MSKYKLEISEYGTTVRTYSDDNRDKFMEEAKRIIADHIDRRCRQSHDDVKNTQFRIFTES